MRQLFVNTDEFTLEELTTACAKGSLAVPEDVPGYADAGSYVVVVLVDQGAVHARCAARQRQADAQSAQECSLGCARRGTRNDDYAVAGILRSTLGL